MKHYTSAYTLVKVLSRIIYVISEFNGEGHPVKTAFILTEHCLVPE